MNVEVVACSLPLDNVVLVLGNDLAVNALWADVPLPVVVAKPPASGEPDKSHKATNHSPYSNSYVIHFVHLLIYKSFLSLSSLYPRKVTCTSLGMFPSVLSWPAGSRVVELTLLCPSLVISQPFNCEVARKDCEWCTG